MPADEKLQHVLDPVDAVAQLTFVVDGMLQRRCREEDLSLIQLRLLGILRDRRPTMSELSRFLELDKSSVSGLVDRAQRRGLVRRVPSETDGRVSVVEITDEGNALVGNASSGFTADVQELLGRLPATDRDRLVVLLTRLLAAHARAHGVDLFADLQQ